MARPMPYPAACHPQAWSAASAILIVQAVLGLEPDVPAGRVRLRPLPGMPLEVRGLRIAGRPVNVRVDAAGTARIEGGPVLSISRE
jgi:glycogen debranching enzyme